MKFPKSSPSKTQSVFETPDPKSGHTVYLSGGVLRNVPDIQKGLPSQSHHKWLVTGITSLLIAMIGLIFAWQVINPRSPLIGQPSVQTSPTPTPQPTPPPEPGMTVLLMGRGGAGHDGGALTDTMLLARILETQKRVVMISIPRDLWVNLPYEANQDHFGKVNSAYAIGIDTNNYKMKKEQYMGPHGGGMLAKDAVTSVTGISIDTYVTIDFSGFEQAIDNIGGVEITVARSFTDYEYPIVGRERADCTLPQEKTEHTPTSVQELIEQGTLSPDNLPKLPKEFPCRYEALHFDAGKQTMNGKTALKYVRSRHSAEEASDFARSNRQKLLVQAVVEKLFTLGQITKVPQFLSTLRSHIDTDLTTPEILAAAPRANEYRSYPITSVSLTTDNYLNQGYTSDRQFALTPIAGEGKYEAIQNWMKSVLDPSTALRYPVIEIASSTKRSATANALKEQFSKKGYPTKTLFGGVATTSATIKILNAQIDPKVLEEIGRTASISAEFTKAVESKTTPISDLRIELP